MLPRHVGTRSASTSELLDRTFHAWCPHRNAVTRSNLQLAQMGKIGLSQMATSDLKKLARSEGVPQAVIDANDEVDDPTTNATLIALITKAMAGSEARWYAEGVPPEPEPEQQEQQAEEAEAPLSRTRSMRQIAQAPEICHYPSRDEIEKEGLIKLVTDGKEYQHISQLAGLRVLMQEQGLGSYCEFVYHLLGSYNEHIVQFDAGTRVVFKGWNGACHRGFQSAQMHSVRIAGHPQPDRCDGEYHWRGRWHDGWPLLERDKAVGASCYCYRGMGSRERRVGDAWVLSDDDEHLDDEDWTGLGFLTCTPAEPLTGLAQTWRCCLADGRWVDCALAVSLLPTHGSMSAQ